MTLLTLLKLGGRCEMRRHMKSYFLGVGGSELMKNTALLPPVELVFPVIPPKNSTKSKPFQPFISMRLECPQTSIHTIVILQVATIN